MHNSLIVSLGFVRVDLVTQSRGHDGDCPVSPFRPLGALAVPVQLAFGSFSRPPCDSARGRFHG
eukprot:4655889-Pyramimonas_sp.AAC.1